MLTLTAVIQWRPHCAHTTNLTPVQPCAPTAYFAYALQIRHEYIHVPLDTYCKVRSDFMSAFAVQERIYATDEMRDRFEATARSNVARECKVLRAVIGAGKGDGGDADVSEDLVEAVRSAT